MGLSINTSIPALSTRRQTEEASGLLSQSLQRIATAQTINRAADDAAGLAIAERLNTQIRQEQQEVANLQSGVSLAQTADSGLLIQQQAVQRLREISLEATNGTLSDQNRAALDGEAQQLLQQLDTVAQDTTFNGQPLLSQNLTIPLGVERSVQVSVPESSVTSLGLATIDLNTAEGATAAVERADAAVNVLNDYRGGLGAQIARFSTAIAQREQSVLNQAAARSLIRDADFAQAIIERTQQETRQQRGILALTQANVSNQAALRVLNR